MGIVTKDTIIIEILRLKEGTAEILFKNGMHCIGCPSSSGESIGDACEVHGLDAEKIITELNEFLDAK